METSRIVSGKSEKSTWKADRRRVLRAAVAEEVLDRQRERDDGRRAPMSTGPRSEARDPARRAPRLGCRSSPECRSLPRAIADGHARICGTCLPPNALSRFVDSHVFTVVVVATIAVNAVVLGLQTYDGLEARWGSLLDLLNAACLAVFIVELGLRDRLLLAAAVEVLQERLEHLRLRRRHGARSCPGYGRTRRCFGSCACSASFGSCGCCPICACSCSASGEAFCRSPRSAR